MRISGDLKVEPLASQKQTKYRFSKLIPPVFCFGLVRTFLGGERVHLPQPMTVHR